MAASSTQFNSDNFSWSDVEVQVGDQILAGCQGVSYGSSQDKDFIYGKGDLPQAIGRGNKAFKGELRVQQIELERLIASAPNADLLDYRNLNIHVAYTSEGGTLIVDAIYGMEFVDVQKAMQQADKGMSVALPIIFLGVNYNI